jgi:hypothetical protein
MVMQHGLFNILLARRMHLSNVAQTAKSAGSRVSKPAGAHDAEPTWKSAIQQVWKPAPRNIGGSALDRNRRGGPTLAKTDLRPPKK